MQNKIIIYLLILFVISCTTLKDSVGPNNLITIVVSPEDEEIINLYLLPLFKKSIRTPIDENLYEIDIANPKKFNKKKYHKNIIIASISEPEDSTGDLLYDKFHEVYNKDIFSISDAYAKNQLIICMKSENLGDFINTIDNYNSWILDTMENNIFSSYYLDVIDNDKETNIINIIKNKYNIDVFIDENYKIIKNDNNFLWVGRGYPYRWLVFNKGKLGSKSTYKDLIIDTFEEKLTNVNIPDKYVKFDSNSSNFIIHGLYEQLDSDTGGPFFTYIFEDYENNEVIFVSGFVNNPGKKKADLVLQLETIIKNIEVLNDE